MVTQLPLGVIVNLSSGTPWSTTHLHATGRCKAMIDRAGHLDWSPREKLPSHSLSVKGKNEMMRGWAFTYYYFFIRSHLLLSLLLSYLFLTHPPTTHGHTLYRPTLFTTFNTHRQRTLDMVKTTMIARVSDGNWRQAALFTTFGVEGTQPPPTPTHTYLHLCAPLRLRILHLALPLAASIDDEQVHFNLLSYSYSQERVSRKYKSLPTKTDVEFCIRTCSHAFIIRSRWSWRSTSRKLSSSSASLTWTRRSDARSSQGATCSSKGKGPRKEKLLCTRLAVFAAGFDRSEGV